MTRLLWTLLAASLVGGTAWTQTGGTPQKKCSNTAAVATAPADWESQTKDTCGDYGVSLPWIGWVGLPGESCPAFKYHLGAHSDCGTAGASPETDCVPDSLIWVQAKECECTTVTIGIFTVEGFSCKCDDEWQNDGAPHNSMKTVPC